MIERLDYSTEAGTLLVEITAVLERLKIADEDQILLTHQRDEVGCDRFLKGAGSIKDMGVSTGNFAYLAEEFKGTRVEAVIRDVRRLAINYHTKIGRVRLLRLKPKTCYSLHTDKEEFRFHIPLVTNRSCLFICGEQISRMEEVGRLYTFRTNLEHTAINASFQNRLHLVFDTWV